MELAIEAALDRAVQVLDHDQAGLMMVFGTCQSEYRLEYVQNPIPHVVIGGLGKRLEFLKPECVVFIVQKGNDKFWVWAGDHEGRTRTMKVPFEMQDCEPVLGLPIEANTLDTLPLELFWGEAK